MKEDLIHFIWRSKMLSSKQLQTTLGEAIEILHPGNLNSDQGPDFLYAQIRINEIQWVGHVELHIKSSDWKTHQHQEDPNYQNTILHVVWEYDTDVDWSGRIISCIELKNYIPLPILDTYKTLMENQLLIPCQAFLDTIRPCIKTNQIDRMMMERLEEKTEKCKQELSAIQWNWEELLYKKIAYYLVAPVNGEAMNSLWQHLPFSLISKLKHDTFKLSAVIFGTAGFLEDPLEDSYYTSLRDEYSFQKTKFKLSKMNAFEWKLLRLRPSHFPALRIAQFCALLSKNRPLFSEILEAGTIKDLYRLLEVYPPDYWSNHYMFNKISPSSGSSALGKQTMDILIINAICPLLFAFGVIYQKEPLLDKAVYFLEKIKPERNHITQMWKSFKFVFNHAGQSQGGIQLFQNYCSQKRCTSCSIGNEILKLP